MRAEAETAAAHDSDAMIRRERKTSLRTIRDDVLPTLDALASTATDPHDPQWRHHCARQAAAVRRMLTQDISTSALSADIRAVIAAAEEHGTIVEMQLRDEVGDIPRALRANIVDLVGRVLAILPEDRALLTLWNTGEDGSVFITAPWHTPTDPLTLIGPLPVNIDVDDGKITAEFRWNLREYNATREQTKIPAGQDPTAFSSPT